MKGFEREVKPALLTVAEAAAEFGCSDDKILDWIAKGLIRHFREPGSRPGRGRKNIRIRREDWQAFLDANTGVARQSPEPVAASSAPGGRTDAAMIRKLFKTRE